MLMILTRVLEDLGEGFEGTRKGLTESLIKRRF